MDVVGGDVQVWRVGLRAVGCSEEVPPRQAQSSGHLPNMPVDVKDLAQSPLAATSATSAISHHHWEDLLP